MALAHFLAKTQTNLTASLFRRPSFLRMDGQNTSYFVLYFAPQSNRSLSSLYKTFFTLFQSECSTMLCILIIFRSYHSPPRIRDVVVVPLIEIQCYILIFHSLLSSRLEDVNFGHANLITFVCNVAI